ncbi:MAG TPA: GGDEF domain-containing protein [Planctomycetota bacterium]|nr:GGDEF domain-containing protein [Planctomycetota bacterium]
MNQQPKHPAKSQGLKHKLWVAYFLLSVIPTLFIIYLISQGAAGNFSMTNPQLIPLAIGIGALILMSISALIILYRSVTSLENITQKTIRLVKENTNVNLLMDTNDETEKLNTCFMEMVKEVQHKINEVNKYAVALGETNKKLSQMAIKDGLTQLYNQIYIKERLENELKRADQFNQYISIMMLDIDDFKKYNDFYGHLAGDNCLKSISGLIKENCREIDIPARYGGEEFLVILPGAKSSEASQVAEKIRQSIASYPFSTIGSAKDKTPKEKTTSLTISVGVSSYYKESDIKTSNELIKAADNALLHQAKKKGKNQVAMYV